MPYRTSSGGVAVFDARSGSNRYNARSNNKAIIKSAPNQHYRKSADEQRRDISLFKLKARHDAVEVFYKALRDESNKLAMARRK